MRSWALVVSRERAEEIRRRLLDRDLLQKHLRIASEGETVLLPIRRQVEMGFPTAEKDFAEGFTAIRSYRDVVEVVEQAGHVLDTILIPKVGSPSDSGRLDRLPGILAKIEQGR